MEDFPKTPAPHRPARCSPAPLLVAQASSLLYAKLSCRNWYDPEHFMRNLSTSASNRSRTLLCATALLRAVTVMVLLSVVPRAVSAEAQADMKNLSVTGGVEQGKARLIIEGWLTGTGGPERTAFATTVHHSIHAAREKVASELVLLIDIVAGSPAELPLTINGEGEIRSITGDGLQDWSIRQETNGTRSLVLRPAKTEKPLTRLTVKVSAETELKMFPGQVSPLTLTPPQTALFNGYLKLTSPADVTVQPQNAPGLIPLEPQFLPEPMREEMKPTEAPVLAFRFQGTSYSAPLAIGFADPESRRVVLRNFNLKGQLASQAASFTLTALASVKDPKGGNLELLSGAVALTQAAQGEDWRIDFKDGKFVLVCEREGEFPLELKFNAKVQQSAEGARGWNTLDFRVAPAALQPLLLGGVSPETQFQFPGGARPERTGEQFKTFLPADGAVKLSWKEAAPESEGKLFFSAEMLSQVSVGPGLMRQTALLDFRVMQGELGRLILLLRGAGEVTRLSGDHVLAWTVEPVTGSTDRRLLVQLNQPQKDQFGLQVQLETPLGAFPQTAEVMQLRAEGATRFAGYFRVVNEGAVRLEVVQSSGVSQISPEKFPETETTRAAFRTGGAQRFAYRFSGQDFGMRIQADQISPELSVSQLTSYRLGENSLTIEAEIELEIREAPVRELLLSIPKGYAIAPLNVANLSDYFTREPEGRPDAELRLVFGQPVTGRQLIPLRLERNKPLGAPAWDLPKVEVLKAKSIRGHLAVSADPGFRITPERTQALTEIATAFFPRKVPGIQSAFRLTDPAWQAVVRVERLPQTVQVDGLHLFSIAEGIAYGSSVLNYSISGAPVSTFKVELSSEYFNVEFTGKDIRNWQKTEGGYLVQLHSPVSGPYTLLATYERPFKSQGETLTFTGARPLDTQSDQGHTVIISAYQFQVKPVDVSPGLLPLETREVPSEYRLLFDAPILAAYRYNTRPFNLRLALSPLAQGESLSQVVDRAALVTRISKEGQVLTDVRYFLKNRGNPHLRLTLPGDTKLWSAAANGTSIVPVLDGATNLLPLPQLADPNAVLTIDLKLASTNKRPSQVRVTAPALGAPVLLADWKLQPDVGQRLVYQSGSLTPATGVADASGFAQLARAFSEGGRLESWGLVLGALLLIGASLVLWRWTAVDSTRFNSRHLAGGLLGLAALVLAGILASALIHKVVQEGRSISNDLAFLAPVQQAGNALTIEVSNIPEKASFLLGLGYLWPLLPVLAAWGWAWLSTRTSSRKLGWLLGWLIVAWAILRIPNSAPALLLLVLLFLLFRAVVPALVQVWRVPPRPESAPPPQAAAAPAATLLLLGALTWAGLTSSHAMAPPIAAQQTNPPRRKAAAVTNARPSAADAAARRTGLRQQPPLARSVLQQVTVEDKFASVTAKVRWQAEKGNCCPCSLSRPC